MSKRRFEATQQSTLRDLQRIMGRISATSLRIDQEFDTIFGGFLAPPDDSALLLGDGKAPWFEVLGVKPNATKSEIRNAFRALSKIHHPDNGGQHEDYIKLRQAYDDGMKATKN